MTTWSHPVPRIADDERRARLQRLREALGEAGAAGLLVGSTETLRYLTGLVWHPSERFCGALVTMDALLYVAPAFEGSRVESLPRLSGDLGLWEEDEDFAAAVADLVPPNGRLLVDPELPLLHFHPLVRALGAERLGDGAGVIDALRSRKSAAEIALIGHAMAITLAVQRTAREAMRPGIRAREIAALLDAEHRRLGADDGSTFAIVSFGAATSLPHGAHGDQTLEPGDVILVDTGCRLDGYHSDLTRTYTLETPSAEVERIWRIERQAQAAVFEAARPGVPLEALDAAARAVLAAHGLGPDYRLPGLAHRTGHGLGLAIHEAPFVVRGNRQALEPGHVVSVEPMIVVPGRFGVRLEDHIHMTAQGPRWFTEPAREPTGV